VPDSATQRQLFQAGKVDVIAPAADTNAGAVLGALGSVTSGVAGPSAVALVNTRRFTDLATRPRDPRRVPAVDLADAVLKGEATAVVPASPSALDINTLSGVSVAIAFPEEDGVLGLAARAAQRVLIRAGAQVDLRARESRRFWDEWFVPADFDVALSQMDVSDRSCAWCHRPTSAMSPAGPIGRAGDWGGADVRGGRGRGAPLWDANTRVLTKPASPACASHRSRGSSAVERPRDVCSVRPRDRCRGARR